MVSEFIGPWSPKFGFVVLQDTSGADRAGWLGNRPAKYPGFHPSVELFLNLLRERGLIGAPIRQGVREVMQVIEALHERGQRAVLDIPEDLLFCPLDHSLDGAKVGLFPLRGGIGYLGTLKIAIRFEPILMVSNSVPTNTSFFPRTLARRQPVPLVILSPLLAFLPCIAISLVAILSGSVEDFVSYHAALR